MTDPTADVQSADVDSVEAPEGNEPLPSTVEPLADDADVTPDDSDEYEEAE